jgi:hypothetical protein
MLRRRRPRKNEAIHFSFDSFLDLVTNVVGIIIRLILATWVGARSYHASMQFIAPEPAPEPVQKAQAPPPPLPPPQITDDPIYDKLEIAKQEMEEAKARLLAQLRELETVESKTKLTQSQLAALAARCAELQGEHKTLEAAGSERGARIQLASLSIEEVHARSRKILADIKLLEAQPSRKKLLKYHAPISQAVHSDELYFECKNGRVTFIDLQAFNIDIDQTKESSARTLRGNNQQKLELTTAAVGPFRLRYTFERIGAGAGMTGWTLEPLAAERGETLQKALAPNSQFRQIADPLDGSITVVTFWVYPDSFELFRQLRDYLYERGLDVAGRPLPPDAPIQASRYGTASRGQ